MMPGDVSRHALRRVPVLAGPPPASPATTELPIVRLLQSLRREAGRWQRDAACIDADPDLFFPERGASSRPAKAICAKCPVRVDCLDYAIGNGEKFGIWGGLPERERRRVKRSRM